MSKYHAQLFTRVAASAIFMAATGSTPVVAHAGMVNGAEGSANRVRSAETGKSLGGVVYAPQSALPPSDLLSYLAGPVGLRRLEQFASLEAGWDGPNSWPLSSRSVSSARLFFDKTRLVVPELGLFMSKAGNLVVNWLAAGSLVELEFEGGMIAYYFEQTGAEGSVSSDSEGYSQLLDILPAA